MLVRIATPGIVARMRSSSLRKIISAGSALHPLQHRGAGMLQRHVDIFHQRLVLGDGVEELLRDFIGIAIEEADPFFMVRFNLRQSRACATVRRTRPQSRSRSSGRMEG